MHILEHLNNLRHHYNFLNNFLNDERYFHDLILSDDDRVCIPDFSFFDDLEDFFSDMYLFNSFLYSFFNDCFLYFSFHFLDFRVVGMDGNNFFFQSFNGL